MALKNKSNRFFGYGYQALNWGGRSQALEYSLYQFHFFLQYFYELEFDYDYENDSSTKEIFKIGKTLSRYNIPFGKYLSTVKRIKLV